MLHRHRINASATLAGVPACVGLPELFTWLVHWLGVNGFCEGVPHIGSASVMQEGSAATQVKIVGQLVRQ